MPHKKLQLTKEVHTLIRYVMIGVPNTLVGVSIVIVFQKLSGNPFLSNTAGFILGGYISYYMHSKKTFCTQPTTRVLRSYILMLFIGYLINIFFLSFLIQLMNSYTAQAMSLSIYMCFTYLASRVVVFRD